MQDMEIWKNSINKVSSLLDGELYLNKRILLLLSDTVLSSVGGNSKIIWQHMEINTEIQGRAI